MHRSWVHLVAIIICALTGKLLLLLQWWFLAKCKPGPAMGQLASIAVDVLGICTMK
jgi:hypothetical protein